MNKSACRLHYLHLLNPSLSKVKVAFPSMDSSFSLNPSQYLSEVKQSISLNSSRVEYLYTLLPRYSSEIIRNSSLSSFTTKKYKFHSIDVASRCKIDCVSRFVTVISLSINGSSHPVIAGSNSTITARLSSMLELSLTTQSNSRSTRYTRNSPTTKTKDIINARFILASVLLQVCQTSLNDVRNILRTPCPEAWARSGRRLCPPR